jgi:spore germination protein KB
MDRIHIDPLGATYLVSMTIMAKLFTPEPRMLALKVGTSAWLVTFLAGLIALVGCWFLFRLLERFPGMSVAAISERVLGGILGRMATLVYIAYFVYLGGLALREFVAGFRIAITPTTPPGALTLVYTIVVVFVAMKGIETLSRLAAYLAPLLAALFLFTLVGPVRVLDWRGLFPLLGNGARTTFLMPFPESSLYSEIMILGVLAGLLKGREIGRVGWSAIIGGMVGQTAAWLVISTAFPYPISSRLFFPMLEVVRMIEVGEVVQRLEALLVFLWFFVAAFKLTLLINGATLLLMEMSGLEDPRPLVMPVTLILYAIAFMPANDVSMVWLDSYTLRIWSWPISFGLPAVTLGVAALRGLRGVASHAAQT